LEGLQGLLGLVEEEDGMVLLVEAAAGLVRVVCPNTVPEINESAAAATRIVRAFIRLPNRIFGGRSWRHERSHPDDPPHFRDVSAG